MAHMSEDIQSASSDSPPMLDRTNFESWQQRIRLYCKGKDNRENKPKSIDEGPFQMGTFQETLDDAAEGALHLGPVRPRVYSDLTLEEKDRQKADICATNILLQGLPKDIYTLINHYIDAKDIWDNVKMLLEGSDRNGQHEVHANKNKMLMERFTQHPNDPLAFFADNTQHDTRLIPTDELLDNLTKQVALLAQSYKNVQGRQNRGQGNNARGSPAAGNGRGQNRVGNANPGQEKPIKCYNCNGSRHIAILDEEELLFLEGGHGNTFDDDVDKAPVQYMAQNEDNIIQAYQCDVFDSDVDEAPMA
ncbi:hypothetical protein Tco_0578625 [Tanacetum coccineum]